MTNRLERDPLPRPEGTLILTVDDDADLRRLGRRYLERSGFEVAEAGDGVEAVQIFTRMRPDLVLLDVNLPERDGFEICSQIRGLAEGGDTPVIMVTGLSDGASVQRAYQAGATDFVTKPVNWVILANRVQYMIQADRARKRLCDSRTRQIETERVACLGTWEWQIAEDRLTWSLESGRILGLSSGCQPVMASLLNVVHPEDRDYAWASLRHAASESQPLELEHRVMRRGSEVRVVRHYAEVVLDRRQEPVALRGIVQDINDRRRAEERIRHMAEHDNLTGLPNRQLLAHILDGALSRNARSTAMTAVLYIDLDRFKKINESLGYRDGDELLKLVGQRVRGMVRKGDVLAREGSPGASAPTSVGRLGGDKFIVLLTELQGAEGAAITARRILGSLARPYELAGRRVFLSASVGIALHPADGETPEVLLQSAESAMYHAKGLGRNRFQFYDDWMNDRSERKLELETELHGAIERGELSIHYQPILDGRGRQTVGVEGLLRWTHPELGSVNPEEFIPIAEDAGLMTSIGEWTLDNACREVSRWHRQGLPKIRLSVNISSCQLKQERFVERVAAVLRDSELAPDYLEVELTEREVMANDPTSIRCLVELKELGVRVSVDDFGTGHSALVYLKKFPLDVVKIDRSFVSGIDSDSSDSAIISAVIAMAHCLQLRVVAEGVETEEQLEFLRQQNCDELQGFFFSRPLDAAAAHRWLKTAAADCRQLPSTTA